MKLVDDRTEEEKSTHLVLWGGTDSFLSGWGGAEGGSSYAFWACRPEDSLACERWVRSRGDMKRVREVTTDYRPPSAPGHCHIYVWEGR
jgi:hypothetical protein